VRLVSADLDDEVAGSAQGDVFTASVWRDGSLLVPSLGIKSCALGWDVSRDVQGQMTLVASDPDGSLSPWGMGDPLGPGGSLLSLAWQSGISGARVTYGQWRIRKSAPTERWLVYGSSRGPIRVSSGAEVTIQADEAITAAASICRLDGEAIPVGATVYGELQRILRDYGSVDTTLAPANAVIPATYVYPESRTAAVGDLLDMISATARIGPDGSLQVVPLSGVGPVWTIQGGVGGALVDLTRSLSDAATYNAVTSKGTAADGTPLIGRAYLGTGPLAFGGPYGKVPYFHQAIATTQAGVDADARTLRDQQITSGTIDLPVSCLAHPGIQPHDLVTVVAPTIAGDIPLIGRVVAMSWQTVQSDKGIVPSKSMSLTVRVSTETLEAVSVQVRRG
jgi:hypothetical protein